jgi:O-antigen/teichoic acid export membrane protein
MFTIFRRRPETAEPIPAEEPGQPLSKLAVRGGAYLVGREGIGMVIRLVGVVITLRLIGPEAFGLYSGALAFTVVVTTVVQLGAEVYLIRMPDMPTREKYDEVFTYLVVTSTVVVGLAFGATFIFGGSLRPVGVLLPLRILLFAIPINALWAPAQAKIERGFGYRKMGILEIGGDFALYGTAVPLAYLGAGTWSLVSGFFVWQTFLLIGSYAMSGLRPRLRWSRQTARDLTKFGFSFSLATWISLLGALANPLIVGRFYGARGVGFVAFAQRLVDTIGFASRGAYRLGMVAMSRVPDEQTHRLRRAIEDGSQLQLIALGLPFAVFGVMAPTAIPLLFGREWTPAIHLYSLLALGSFFGASALLQTTLLWSRGRNLSVAVASFMGSVVLGVGAIFLVRRYGIEGFGYASLLALLDLIYLDRTVRSIVSFSYRNYALVAITLAPMVAYPLIPVPISLVVFVPLVVFLIVPYTRRLGLAQVAVVKGAFSRQDPPENPPEEVPT